MTHELSKYYFDTVQAHFSLDCTGSLLVWICSPTLQSGIKTQLNNFQLRLQTFFPRVSMWSFLSLDAEKSTTMPWKIRWNNNQITYDCLDLGKIARASVLARKIKKTVMWRPASRKYLVYLNSCCPLEPGLRQYIPTFHWVVKRRETNQLQAKICQKIICLLQ